MPVAAWGVICALTACTGSFHKRWADREVFGILRSKASKVPNSGQGLFDISPPPPVSLEKLSKNFTTVEFLGDRAEIEKGARVITLADSLQFGVSRNRTYLGQKELVYLKALDLTGARHEFAPIVGASGSGSYVNKNLEQGVNSFIAEKTLATSGGVSFASLQRTGTRLAVDLTTDFVRFVTGNLTKSSDSRLAVTLSQPLLRGAGVLAASEPLTQAERDVLYGIRDFTQYRKTFAISVTSQYYQTLQARDTAKNAYLAYQAFKRIIGEQTALADANRRTRSSLGLLQQAELNYHRRWISAVRSYEEALDELKLQLGLPVTERIILDQHELDKLELINPPGTFDEAMQTALVTRLDLSNERDAVADAERKVKIAQQDLLPGLNTILAYDLAGDTKSDGVGVDRRRRKVSASLDVDLHLDQKPSRNVLREAQIIEQQARRALELAEEEVRRDVRASWRNLDVGRRQYELAQISVKLNESRLALEENLDAEGRGASRDLIDAQTAVIQAHDDLIAALINHTIARLQLWKDMGILFIKKDGQWADVLSKETR